MSRISLPARIQLIEAPVIGAEPASLPLARVFIICALAYVAVYALEGPARFALFLAGKDSLILMRDGLIALPLCLLFAYYALQLRIHPAFVVAGAIFAFHGMVLFGTVGSLIGVAYGVKILLNALFGFFLATTLINPGQRTLRVLTLIWLITIVGVCIDKAGVAFPWTGIQTVIGEISVDVSKDWFIQDPMARRVAGFTRSSISVAVLVPLLSIVLINRARYTFTRFILAFIAVAAVFMTTQKGAIIAIAPIAFILCMPAEMRLSWLRFVCVMFIVLAMALPLATLGLHFDHGSGVFSMESLFLRIDHTWPDAWDWITRNQMMIFGVGIGGIGGPQRLFAPSDFNPADNIFVLMYAYFGVVSLVYILATCRLALRRNSSPTQHLEPAVAIIAFTFGYGMVLSVLEDQMATLFLGAALGALWPRTAPETHREPTHAQPRYRSRANVFQH
jgi:hypothetical protein